MSDDQSTVLDEADRQDIISNAYAIAATLQKTGNPIRSLRILSVAAGMTICASAKNRAHVDSIIETVAAQTKSWCDYEEQEKMASWVDKTS